MTVNWVEVKKVATDKQLSMTWLDLGSRYIVGVVSLPVSLECIIKKEELPTEDQKDFEDNYKE